VLAGWFGREVAAYDQRVSYELLAMVWFSGVAFSFRNQQTTGSAEAGNITGAWDCRGKWLVQKQARSSDRLCFTGDAV